MGMCFCFFTAPVPPSLPCQTLSFLSTQVQPGTKRETKMKAAASGTNMKQPPPKKIEKKMLMLPVLAVCHLIISLFPLQL